jgi:hypothetical protein
MGSHTSMVMGTLTLRVENVSRVFAAFKKVQWWQSHVGYHFGHVASRDILTGGIVSIKQVFVLEQVPNLNLISKLST